MARESAMVNIRFPYFFLMLTEDTAKSPPVYDGGFQISEATTLTRTPTIQNVPAFADGIIVENYSGSPGGTISLGIHALPLEHAQIMFGSRFDANGVLLSGSDDNPPYGALAFEANKGNGKTRWTVLYKVKFQVPELTLNTKTETVTWQQPTLNATYQSRMDFYIDENGKRVNLVFAEYDEDNVNFNAEIAQNWYKEVYEPTAPTIAPVESVTLDKTSLSLSIGETQRLNITILPENASNKNVIWKSEDESIATVDASCMVEGISAGTTEIVAEASGGKKATCTVTVTEV